jgi:hypothetical protein
MPCLVRRAHFFRTKQRLSVYIWPMHKLFLIAALLGILTSGHGKERIPYIKISADIAYAPVFLLQERQQFKGEFFPDAGFLIPEWQEIDESQSLHQQYRSSGITGRLGFNFWKQLYLGVRYSTLNIKGYDKPGVRGGLFVDEKNTFFFFVGMTAGYIWQPIQAKPQFSILPMLGFGTYISDEFYAGPGSKLNFHSSLKVQYLFKERYGLFVAPAFSFWQYKDKGYSNFFERETSDRIRMHSLGLEAGFSFQINIDRKP